MFNSLYTPSSMDLWQGRTDSEENFDAYRWHQWIEIIDLNDDKLKFIKYIIRSGKVVSFDIAEVSPRFDQDNTTANLAAVIIFSLVTPWPS